jgi:hypothetical protein
VRTRGARYIAAISVHYKLYSPSESHITICDMMRDAVSHDRTQAEPRAGDSGEPGRACWSARAPRERGGPRRGPRRGAGGRAAPAARAAGTTLLDRTRGRNVRTPVREECSDLKKRKTLPSRLEMHPTPRHTDVQAPAVAGPLSRSCCLANACSYGKAEGPSSNNSPYAK